MPRPSADGPGGPPEARARAPPAPEGELAAAQSAAYRDAVEQWRRLEARQEERRQRLEARAAHEGRVDAREDRVEDLAPPSATEPPAWVRAQGAPPAWAQRLEARVQAEEERSWGAPPDWGESRPWASPREVELRLWLSANVGSPARRRAVLDVAECLDDLRYCQWDALEHHLALADWPALTRRRFVVAVRALRAASPPDSAAETLAYAWADDAEGGDEAWAARADAAAAANDRARRERVDAAIAAARAMPRARSESVSSESSDEAARRRRRRDDAESDSDDESDGAMPPLEDAADGCVPPVPWRAESIVRRLAAAPPDEAACCPICLDALSGAVVAMPCRWLEDGDRAVPHAFHRDCALELLNASAARGERVPRCPTCRDDFPPHLLVAHPEDF